ncbi:MAG: hypothetical protein DMG33_14790 [Acidobacteria bacterium]|nr:MAG: hypothetical protein DMG33_14790 [Acidobacteriota bacterium]
MAKFARGYIFVGLLILISAPRAHAGLVQTSSGTPGAPVSTYSVGFSSPVTTSDLVLVAIGTNVPTATITSVTDALGNTFTPATGLVADPNRGLGEQIWMAFLKASGTDTVAVSVSQAANLHVIVAEYSGIAAVVDALAAAGPVSGTAADSGALTTLTPGDLLFGHVVTEHLNHTFTAGTGSLRQTSPSGASAIEDQLVSATGGYHATFILDTADYWICALVALKPAATSTPSLPTISGVMNLIVQNICSATATTGCVNGFQITHIDPTTGTTVIDATVLIPSSLTYTVNAIGKDATGNATFAPPIALLFSFSPSP